MGFLKGFLKTSDTFLSAVNSFLTAQIKKSNDNMILFDSFHKYVKNDSFLTVEKKTDIWMKKIVSNYSVIFFHFVPEG